MSVSPARGAHYQESGLQKTLQKQWKSNQKTITVLIEESIENLSVLGSILDVKIHQKALEKPSEKQA